MPRTLILLGILPLLAFSQPPLDSLQQVWRDTRQPDSSRFDALLLWAEATESADSALRLLHSLYDTAAYRGDLPWMATARLEMAAWTQGAADYPLALAWVAEARALADSASAPALVGKAWVRQGLIEASQREPDQAKASIRAGIAYLQAADDRPALAWGLEQLGVVYHNQAQYDSAVALNRQALVLYQSWGEMSEVAKCLYGIGLAYYQLNQDDSARHYFSANLDLAAELGDAQGQANVLVDLGQLALFDGDYGEAMTYYEQGLRIARAQALVKPTGWLLQAIGLVYFAQNQWDEALRHFTESLATEEAAGDVYLRMDLMDGMGLSYSRQENPEAALRHFERGRVMAEEIKNPFFLAKFANRMGLLHHQQGQYAAAEADFRRALATYQEIKNVDGEANTWYRLGLTYQAQGNLTQAIAAFERALPMADGLQAKPLMARITKELHMAYRQTGQYQQALETFDQYIALRDSLHDQNNQAATLRYEYETKALTDSLAYVEAKAVTDLAHQRQLSLRNYLLIAALALGLLGIGFLRYRQQVRSRTREAELQQARARQEQLAELGRLKSRFFANISHELRTPLTLMTAPLDHLLAQNRTWEPDRMRQELTRIQRNGRSLLRLVEEILDLSKLEAQQLRLHEAPVQVARMVQDVAATFEPSFAQRGIRFSLDLDLAPDRWVMLDRPKVEKILNNYLSNALKFTPEGGRIQLRVQETADRLAFQVQDSGPGIAPADLPHVFDRFYQAGQEQAVAQGGTGIGLSLVRELAQLMAGQAYVESRLGAGSTFYIELPKRVAAGIAPVIDIPEVADGASPTVGGDFTILVVEDNPDMRAFIAGLLSPVYARVLEARHGREALARLEAEGDRIDLVLSDVMMPELDGLGLLRLIKERPAWRHLPVLMLTALASERDKLGALTLGVDDYLVKPFSVPELLARVQNQLSRVQERKAWLQSAEYQAEAEADEAPALSPLDQEWIEGLRQFVENALPETKLDVDTLADAAHLSPRQLRRRLKTLTGLSPAKFIKEIQLERARQALEDGRVVSLSDLAYNCGFEHQTTFSTLFKARYGKSPSAYLKHLAS